jgi:conjugal transfer mating pair stabilization protein TraG
MFDIEISTYWNVETLYQFFNGVASLMADATFITAARLMFGIAFLFGLFAWSKSRLLEWSMSFVWALVFFALLTTARTNVLLVDRANLEPPKAIQNVPTVLAVSVKVTNAVGTWLTYKYESIFNVPTELSLATGDLAFGHRILKGVNRVKISDAALQADLMQFVKECTLYDIRDGAITEANLLKSVDSWTTMWTNTSPARFVTLGTLSGAPQLLTCVDAATGAGPLSLSTRVNAGVAASITQYGRSAFPRASTDAVASQLYINAVARSYDWIIGASVNASDAMKQGMFNALWKDAGTELPSMLNDPARASEVNTLLASAAAGRAADGANSSISLLAQESIPHYRNWLQAILLGFFPILVLLMMATSQSDRISMFIGYIKLLAWIELIPVTFAMLNHLSMILLQKKAAALKLADSGGVTFQMTDAFDATIQDEQALLGYMVVAAPFMTWALIRMASGQFSGMFDRGLTNTISNASSNASELSKGNISMGNASLDSVAANQTSMMKFDSGMSLAGGGSAMQMSNGSMAMRAPSGSVALQQFTSNLTSSLRSGQSQGAGSITRAETGTSFSTNEGTQVRNSDSASLNQTKGTFSSRDANQSSGTVAGLMMSGGQQRSFNTGAAQSSDELRRSNYLESEGASGVIGARGGVSFGLPPGKEVGGGASPAGGVASPNPGASSRSSGANVTPGSVKTPNRLREIANALSLNTAFQVDTTSTAEARGSRDWSTGNNRSGTSGYDNRFSSGVSGTSGTSASFGASSAQGNRQSLDATRGSTEEFSKSRGVSIDERSGTSTFADQDQRRTASYERDLTRDPDYLEKVALRQGISVQRMLNGGSEYVQRVMDEYSSERMAAGIQMPQTLPNGQPVPSRSSVTQDYALQRSQLRNTTDAKDKENVKGTRFNGTSPVKPNMSQSQAILGATRDASASPTPLGPTTYQPTQREKGIPISKITNAEGDVGASPISMPGAVDEIRGSINRTGLQNIWDSLRGKSTGLKPDKDNK